MASMAIWVMLLAACSGEKGSGKPAVAVSTAPQAWLLEQLAGDKYDVVTMLPSGANPETYDPTVADLAKMSDCKAYFQMNTAGFEANMVAKFMSNFNDRNLKLVDVSQGITRLHDGHEGDENGDPHLLTSVRNAQKMAANMAASLSDLDPSNRDFYTHRHDSLNAVLTALDNRIDSLLSAQSAHAFVIQHPSLGYFAQDYGIEQIALESGGKEPTPKELAERLDYAKTQKPSVMFFEYQHNPAQAAEMAKQLGLPTVELNLNSAEWPQEMLKVASSFKSQSR